MKKTKLILSFVAGLIVMGQTLFSAPMVSAVSRTDSVAGASAGNHLVFNTTDDPVVNANPSTTATLNSAGISNSPSDGGNDITTADTNLNQIFTWRLPNLTNQVCSNATLTSLHVTASVSADTEGNPDLAALSVYRVNGGNTHNLNNYTVQQGTDYATATTFFTPPNNEGISGVARGTDASLGGVLGGQLEATWDLSSFTPSDTFGIMVQQDSQDGSVNLQTTITDVQLTYDDASCVYDGAITKTLLNPTSVHPGGTATYEITLTNNGNEPIGFNGTEDRGVYEIPSPSLSFLSVSSDSTDVECQDAGVVQDLFVSDPSQLVAYHNHLDYHFLLCASQSSLIIAPGDSVSFQVTFAVSPDATQITNFASYVIDNDPGLVTLAARYNTITSDGPDMIDLILSGSVSENNVATSNYVFPRTATASTKLASSGFGLTSVVLLVAGTVGLTGIVIIRRRKKFSMR